MKHHRLILILILAVMILTAPAAHAKQYYFQHYDIKNGLSQNTVHCILQDRQGFMWFATKDGLNRFDGHSFQRIGVNDDDEKCSFISTLFEDSQGKIWVSAHSGPCIYDPETERMEWLHAATDDGMKLDRTVNDFCELPDGRIVMAPEDGDIVAYDPASGRLERMLGGSRDLHVIFSHIHLLPNGRIYMGTYGNGLYCSDDMLQTARQIDCGEDCRDFTTSVVNVIEHKGEKLYVGTDNLGLVAVDTRTDAIDSVLSTDENGIRPIVRDLRLDGSDIWVGTESGLYIYDLTRGIISEHLTHNYFDKYSLSDDAIYSICADREGGIWIGSYFGGADYLSHRQLLFEKYFRNNLDGSLPSERVRELCRTVDGRIFVGSEDRGISSFDPASGRFSRVEGINQKNIHGMCIDGDDLWVGTFAEGLSVKNLKTGRIRRYAIRINGFEPHGLRSNYVFSILRTLHGDIYIGTMSGLQRYDRATDSFVSIDELDNTFIYNLAEDSQGNIWISTYSNGLYLKRPGENSLTVFTSRASEPASLPSNKVYSVQEDRNHNIWVLTQNGPCIYRPATNDFDRRYLGIDRIPGVVYRMADDEAGRYWLTSNHGLYCIEGEKGSMRNFTTADGLPTNQFNYNSSLQSPDGKIYFGSVEGLVAFNPLRYTVNSSQFAKPLISEFYLHGELMKPCRDGSPLRESISQSESLELEPTENSLRFRIVTLNYNTPGEQRIKYMLEGFDTEWKYTALKDALLSYSNLDHGTYRLKAAVCSENEEASGPVLDMKITIATPWYLTTWAYMVYALLIAAAVYLAFRLYRRYSRLENQRYLEHYTREKEREAFESKIKFFTNVAHEIRTPLTLIKAPLDCVFHSQVLSKDTEAKENLDVINLNVDRLLLLANQLLDFRKIEDGKSKIVRRRCDIKELIESVVPRFQPTVGKSGKTLTLNVPDSPVMANVDSEAITKIVSNLFTNAIKYGSTYINVTLTDAPDRFTLRFANDGAIVARDKREEIFSLFTRLESNQSGAGIGLAYARSLAQMHGGTLAMDDSLDENVFILSVPKGKPDAEAEENGSHVDLESMLGPGDESVSVLLVEDNEEMLSFIEKKLIANGYRVFTATNGLEALRVLNDQYIEIVISDVMMPEMDGTELLARIKGDINYSHIPVILLTAKTQMQDKLSGLAAGADAYIEKPFAVEYLLVTIGSILRNRERMRRRLESMPLTKTPVKGLTKVDEEFLRKINEIIRSNFNNPEFSMEDVISSLGMSRTTFYRKIKGMLDLNPNDYIKIQRLKRAAQLFQEGHTGVSEVCYMVGFSSPGYFTKCFQKQFGVSPKEYINGKGRKGDE